MISWRVFRFNCCKVASCNHLPEAFWRLFAGRDGNIRLLGIYVASKLDVVAAAPLLVAVFPTSSCYCYCCCCCWSKRDDNGEEEKITQKI